MSDPLRAAAQAIFDAAINSGFPRDEIDPESSYAQSVTLRGRDLADLRAALAADTARVGHSVQDVQEVCPVCGTPGRIVSSDEGTAHFTTRPGLDDLRGWWDSLTAIERWEAFRIEKSNAEALYARLTEDRP